MIKSAADTGSFIFRVLVCGLTFWCGTIIYAPEVVYRLTSKAVISVEPTNTPDDSIAEINWVPVDKTTGLEP